MPEVKSQPMPGLCALCCNAMLTAAEFAVHTAGDEYHEMPPGSQYNVLQDMASGEWQVNEIRIEVDDRNELLPMAAVSFAAGTAVCATHIGTVLRTADLAKPRTVIDMGGVKYVVEGVAPEDLV